MAALAAVLAGGLAAPSHAEGPAAPAAGVVNDLTGDGRADVLSWDYPDLDVLPAGGAPYKASTAERSPEGAEWRSYQISRRGSATGSKTDDLYVFSDATDTLYLYPNDANSGGSPGYFTHKDGVVRVAKPATCAAGTDCTGYDPTWNSTAQVLATDGVLNSDGMPDLITVEGGRLWYYPGKAGGAVIGAPVLLGTGDWSRSRLIAPGKVAGVSALWAVPESGVGTATYRLEFGQDGLPVQLLPSPNTTFLLQNGEDLSGEKQCYVLGGRATRACSRLTTPDWQVVSDGTLRTGGYCLTGTTGGTLSKALCSPSTAGQTWKHVSGGGLQAEDGSCLTVSPSFQVGLAPCDQSRRQSWGTYVPDPGVGPGPFPPAFALLPRPPASPYQDSHFGERGNYSQGDLDGDGAPELITVAEVDYSGLVLLVRRGAAPVDGVARFGDQVSLGSLGSSNRTIRGLYELNTAGVLYSACTSLKVDLQGSLVVTELATGRVLWSSDTPGHPRSYAALNGQGVLELRGPDDRPYWTAPSSGPEDVSSALTLQDDCNLVLRDRNGTPRWSTRTYDPAHETYGAPLGAGRTLASGQQLVADRTVLGMQGDGNLVLTDRQSSRVLWSSGTYGHDGATVTMQTDGNLVIQDASGTPLWASGTWPSAGAHLVVQPDGNLVVYDADGGPRWSTGTWYGGVVSKGAPFQSGRTLWPGEAIESVAGRLVMQWDGNLVLTSKLTGNVRWASGTWNRPGATATMQSDGNLVVRDAGGTGLWSTGTWTHSNAHAVVQDDLNLVVYDQAGNARWASGTDTGAAARHGIGFAPGTVLRSGTAWAFLYTDTPSFLRMQSDGNLVIAKREPQPLWASGTWRYPGAQAQVQADGNVVIRDVNGNPRWATGTWNHPGAYLVFQRDGNLVVYDADGALPLWASGTGV